MCGDVPTTPTMGIALLVMHKADCIGFAAIPSVEPLSVPEPTTWGESHPVGAVCSYYAVDDDTYTILVYGRRFACIDDGAAAVAGPRVCHDVPDIVTAINYVAGVTT
jgi:hypothetical protein